MSAKAYTVCEIGWEYDDESYYRPECDGGTPLKVYLSKADAEAEADRLNKERLAKQDYRMEKQNRYGDYEAITEFYEVIEVEMMES